MGNYIRYFETGEIYSIGFTDIPFDEMISPPNSTLIMNGTADVNTQYIANNMVVDYTESELYVKNNLSTGYRWKMPDKIAEKYLTDDEINGIIASEVRSKRNELLLEVDAINPIRWNSFTEEKRQSWITYRQMLLDIPQQSNFPNDIIWPTKPD